jgi:AraC-like DNA-binding protein
MGSPENTPDIRLTLAADVGRIELIHARMGRHSIPPHIHDEYSISVTVRGGLAFDHKGTKHVAGSGIISCVAPGEVHNAYAGSGGDWQFISLLVPTPVVQEVLTGLYASDILPDLPRRVVCDADLVRRLTELYSLLTAGGDLLERQSARTMVLGDFFRLYSTAQSPARRVRPESAGIVRARDLIHAQFAQPISLTMLAAHAGLSPYHFLRTFRAAMGITPHMYLTQVRVAQAKRMLARGALAAETALACGFCDQSHMNRQFKRVLFTTPAQYRSVIQRPLYA